MYFILNLIKNPLIEQYVVDNFNWEVHYSLEDFKCTDSCPIDCPDQLLRYKMYDGQKITRSPENHLGRGGAGRVYRSTWHGQPSAFKFTRMDNLQYIGNLGHKVSTITSI